jgi:hypothetical protein
MTTPDALLFQMSLGAPILDMLDDPILDMTGDPILDMGWVDVQGDVITETPISIFQGQHNGEPLDRVADAGTIKFVLNNNNSNSAGLVGYYSLGHSNQRPGFGKGLLVRVGIEKDAAIEYLSQGRIISIEPTAGLLSNKRVDVVAADWIEIASRMPMPRIPVQEGVTDDQVIATIVAAIDDPPAETDLGTGAYTYDYALTDVDDGETKVLAVLQRLAQSGLARIFVVGGPTSGEILTYVDLFGLLSTGTPVAAFNNDFTDMQVKSEAYARVKRVQVTGYPMRKEASPVVLYNLTSEISIAAGEEVEFIGFYRDPNASSSRSIAAVDVVTPVINTDFRLSSLSGSGTDLNADLQILDFQPGAKSYSIKVRNNAAVAGYFWFFQVRGFALYPYDSISYTINDPSIKEGEGITLNYDLPYHSNYYTIKDIGTALQRWYNPDVIDVPTLEFTPTLSDADFNKFLACKPGTIISVTDDVTAVSYIMVVLGREINIWNGGNYITERLFITPAQQTENGLFFELDVLGQDDLDGDNTILAFG